MKYFHDYVSSIKRQGLLPYECYQKTYQMISLTTDYYHNGRQAFLEYCTIHCTRHIARNYINVIPNVETITNRVVDNNERNTESTINAPFGEARANCVASVIWRSTSGTDKSSGWISDVVVVVVAGHRRECTTYVDEDGCRGRRGREGRVAAVINSHGREKHPSVGCAFIGRPRTQPVHVELSKWELRTESLSTPTVGL